LSSKKLIKLGNPNCKIPGSLGRIVKSKKIFAEGSDEETIDPIPSINKKINDYYISFYGPQEGCIKNPENSSSPSAKWLYAELNEIFKAWERFTGIKRNIF
jgi:hypothetical protein